MLTETKERIAQLVEINRGLAQDLDVSRRVVADISRERDVLREYVETLQSELQYKGAMSDRAQLQQTIAMEEIHQERARVVHEAESVNARVAEVERQVISLASQLRQMAEERDDALYQLAETTAAMEEIHSRLSGTNFFCENQEPWSMKSDQRRFL